MRLRITLPVFALMLFSVVTAGQQEFADLVRNGHTATLSVFGSRPLDVAAIKLAQEFGIAVNVEDPQYFYRGDLDDVTAQVARVPNPPRRTLIPRALLLEIAFGIGSDGAPRELSTLLQALVDTANLRAPYAYRIDTAGEMFTLVATRTRDNQGRLVELTPILDHRVSIPSRSRRVFEHVRLLTGELERQTGLRIGCCQAAVAGVPWGSTVINFGAQNEPARRALLRLVRSEAGQNHWLLRCQPGEADCFINVARVAAIP